MGRLTTIEGAIEAYRTTHQLDDGSKIDLSDPLRQRELAHWINNSLATVKDFGPTPPLARISLGEATVEVWR